MSGLAERGRPAVDVLAELDAMRSGDVRWRDGRAFTLVYYAGPELYEVARQAYELYMAENGLNTNAFPSLARMQSEVVEMVLGLMHGSTAAGFMTSGGTESILMAVLAARERGRAERNVAAPEMVLPASAHAAFEKAAHYFGVKSVRVPVRADWRADVDAMAAVVNDSTVLVVGSSPQYPQGVVDPIEAIAAIASDRGISCHVDACMGGITLPFLEQLGRAIPPWDFRVDGVTSISVDLHKFGYTAKGASVIAYRTKELRRYQTFVTDNWLGGLYGSSGVLGTKSGGAMAAAWAVMNHLGQDGYRQLTATARAATERLAVGIGEIDGLVLRAEPDTTLLAFGATGDVDAFAVADALWRRGWYIDRQGPPPSLHCTINAAHDAVIDGFLADLAACVDEVRTSARSGGQGAYGTIE
ncbi:MAG: aminotransferase class V-fold PLP-dependent enzyme [Acidimicrobiales bacterium]